MNSHPRYYRARYVGGPRYVRGRRSLSALLLQLAGRYLVLTARVSALFLVFVLGAMGGQR
jgi:hypothetical protein